MAIFNDVKNAITGAAQSVSTKTKESAEIARLSNEIRNANNELTGTYEQIGRVYVAGDGAIDDSIDSLVTRAKELIAQIDEAEKQKLALKNRNRCPSCASVMGKNAKFCSNCGAKLPEQEAPAPAPAPEAPKITYCPACGAMRKNDDAYCELCGFCFEPAEDTVEDASEDVIISAPVVSEAVVSDPADEDEIPSEND